MIITIQKDGMIPLSTFEKYLDISQIAWYTLKVNKDKTLTLKFYNKSKKLIKPYKEKQNEKVKKRKKVQK